MEEAEEEVERAEGKQEEEEVMIERKIKNKSMNQIKKKMIARDTI